MKYFISIFLSFSVFTVHGQNLSQGYLDSLDDEALLTLFIEVESDSTNAERVARTYLNRARKEKDTIKMARGYDRLARIFHPEKSIQFADSVIALTEKNPQITYPAGGYALKAYYYNLSGDFELSTNNFIEAYKFAQISNNIPQQVYVLNHLIYRKAIWGDKEEALINQRKRDCLINTNYYLESILASIREGSNINKEDMLVYERIVSTRNFAFCHYQLNNLDSAKFYLKKMDLLLSDYNWHDKQILMNWSVEALMEISYFKSDYLKSSGLADSILKIYDYNKASKSVMNAYLFKGLSIKKLKKHDESIENLLLADSVYDNLSVHGSHPHERVIFEELLDYYEKRNDTVNQLQYLKKLVSIDSIFKIKFHYFELNLEKEIETPELLRKKDYLILSLKDQERKVGYKIGLIAVMLFISIFLASFYLRKLLIYKKRFVKLKESLGSEKDDTFQSLNFKSIPSKEVESEILAKLKEFELTNKFLNKNLSLSFLAKSLKTNENYLSRVINIKLHKNFSQYIHDLRLNYAVNDLMSIEKYRKYTIKAIAEECGYKNAESFSRAFYKKYKIHPSYYINQMNKSTSQK